VVASDAQGSRHDHLLEFLDRNPDVPVVDLARLPALLEHTTPSVGGAVETSRHLRVAHPALVATSRLVSVLAHFGDMRGMLAIVDPVSTHGREAIELLARQTATRLQGEPVTALIYGHVRTFNVIAIDAFDLQEEAAQVMPNVPLAVTHSLSGVFHGHLAHLGLVFSERVDPDDIRDALSQTEGIEISDLPVSLDAVPDRDSAVITPPVMSPDGRQLAVTVMADGLRIGGALTAIDILESLV
jgi:aspartate-semialdehyde dehydrogenase